MGKKFDDLVKVARGVRRRLENAKGYTLANYCAIASYRIWKSARRRGIACDFMMGHFDEQRLHRDRGEINHCWVRSQGQIIDVTATQFDYNLPRVLVIPAKDARYKTRYVNDRAVVELEYWPQEQQPRRKRPEYV